MCSVVTERLEAKGGPEMNWYERELMAKSREKELERDVENRRRTTGERKPFHFWLVAVVRAWTIGTWR
jgi:hypothetical protein